MKENPEYDFIKDSIEQFYQNLMKIGEVINNNVFSDQELLEMMHFLILIKERIESLEDIYSQKH